MKVATYNVNSIRMRLDTVLEWLSDQEPDVLALQETKVTDDKFPVHEFEDHGWHVALHGQKAYNGVALVSRHPIQQVRMGFEDPLWPEDCRILTAEVQGLAVVNTYVPNGTAVGTDKFDYKLRWLERLLQFMHVRYSPSTDLIWLGDINIAPKPNDVWDSPRHRGRVGHHPEEFARLDKLVEWGFTDLFRELTPDGGHYTFWDYVIPRSFENNLGWRIDHIYGTEPLRSRLRACTIDRAPRSVPKPSDHTVVVAEFD